MEQNKNDQNKQEQAKPIRTEREKGNESVKPKTKEEIVKEKRLYLYTAISCAVALVAIVIIAIATAGDAKIDHQMQVGNSVSTDIADSGSSNEPTPEKPVVTLPEGMIAPLETVNVGNDYGFYYNQTLKVYHEHAGLDFTAAAGTNVLAVEKGVVESIYKDDLLLGTEIVIRHEDGLRSVYRFVTEAEGLKVGDSVEKGDVIATVAEATGDEYKDGAHLHFEVVKDGVSVDPMQYLTLEEK
jgi:murein DD-endopeptidase MepM/ murein hydrolase activator NlpD